MNGGPTAQELLGSASQRAIDAQLQRLRSCVRCGQTYREANNLGTWRCRGYHAMQAFHTAHQTNYACCGRTTGAPGCVPADHTDEYEYEREPEVVGEAIAETVVARNSRWSRESQTGPWYVQRVDKAALERAYEQMHQFNTEPLKNSTMI